MVKRYATSSRKTVWGVKAASDEYHIVCEFAAAVVDEDPVVARLDVVAVKLLDVEVIDGRGVAGGGGGEELDADAASVDELVARL